MRLEDQARAVLDRRLLAAHPRPVALALSGGGDSLALLLLAADWAKDAGRPLLALTVDHGLNPASGAWTRACRLAAERAGSGFQALRWTGPKPTTGLPAAARAARHRLLADAAREAGARVILTGHTASDVGEARTMRAAGSTTPEPVEWAPSPAWPQGRGLFLARPLLAAGRGGIRDWLRARGETWIEDPANDDPRFARSRARVAAPAGGPQPREDLSRFAAAVSGDADAGLVLTRAAAAHPVVLAMAATCAGGGDRRTSGVALAARVAAGERFVATLAGARIEAGDEVRLFREPGRAGLPQATVGGVWDGRYEMAADGPVAGLAGRARALPKDQRERLAALPPAARRALPVHLKETGAVLATGRPLARERLLAALGAIPREPP